MKRVNSWRGALDVAWRVWVLLAILYLLVLGVYSLFGFWAGLAFLGAVAMAAGWGSEEELTRLQRSQEEGKP